MCISLLWLLSYGVVSVFCCYGVGSIKSRCRLVRLSEWSIRFGNLILGGTDLFDRSGRISDFLEVIFIQSENYSSSVTSVTSIVSCYYQLGVVSINQLLLVMIHNSEELFVAPCFLMNNLSSSDNVILVISYVDEYLN